MDPDEPDLGCRNRLARVRTAIFFDVCFPRAVSFGPYPMTYQPAPLDTEHADLPDRLTPLLEQLAQHVHDTWAQRRIDDGWTYGEERDDTKKTHPCLVPYDDLPEAEKAYDRQTAVETLKAIQVLGYDIVPVDVAGPGDS